ncbi:DUF6263 family protein [uncultured Dokdonia sp.]|uniref:DUF6263 family protein n=1 Tax=uncultured Dokdonia sp. TaxID=575653 RepID=UPI00262E9F65|nr:DUF6263 family protein [uncultured Dokdonia sp.]
MVRKNNFFVTLFLIVSYTTIGQVNLKYSLEVNDNFILQQDAVQTITQDIQGNIQEVENKIKSTIHFTVTKKTRRAITLNVGFKSYSAKTSSPELGILMDVDTHIEQETPQGKAFMGLIESYITIVINRSGKVIDIQNVDAFVLGLLSKMDIEDDKLLEVSKKGLEKEWGAKHLGSFFEQILYNYSRRKVDIGDSWKNTFEAKNGLSANNTWTLDAIENNTYKISCVADITLQVDSDKIIMNLTGTQQTELIADSSNGLPVKLTVISSNEGDSFSKSIGDFKIPTKITSITTYTRL